MGRLIDLNSDTGESFGVWSLGDDRGVLAHVTSTNIACGFHAGDPQVMLATVRSAKEQCVAVGAHPGYRDLAGFGRRSMTCTPDEVYADCLYQIGALVAVCTAEGIPLCHVKPHGALYNQSAGSQKLADAVAAAISAVNPALIMVGLAGTAHETAARKAKLLFAAEAFADRAYCADGSLVPRSQEGAVLHDPLVIAARAVRMVTQGTVVSIDGTQLSLHPDTICVHGDTPEAVAIAAAVSRALKKAEVEVRPLREVLRV